MKRYCLALALKNDQQLIAEYIAHHQHVWPEVLASIKGSGIEIMEIYQVGNRLVMMLETSNDFSFDRKAQSDAVNNEVQAWENLMCRYQQALPFANANEKWVLMKKIFNLT